MIAPPPVLLYDGDCAFCAESVRFVLARDQKGTLRFAPIKGEFGRRVVAEHPELEGRDSMIWVEPASDTRASTTAIYADAALRVARYLGGVWGVARLAFIIPRPVRDAVYRRVARHRHRLLRGAPGCLLPTPETAARFLD